MTRLWKTHKGPKEKWAYMVLCEGVNGNLFPFSGPAVEPIERGTTLSPVTLFGTFQAFGRKAHAEVYAGLLPYARVVRVKLSGVLMKSATEFGTLYAGKRMMIPEVKKPRKGTRSRGKR